MKNGMKNNFKEATLKPCATDSQIYFWKNQKMRNNFTDHGIFISESPTCRAFNL